MVTVPRVSVIMPVYNAASYVGDAISSVLSQTFSDFELLIFEDASKDNTLSIIESFKDPRIKVFKNTSNKGLVHNLNEGIRLSTGEYVARMDADDISLPKRFELQLKMLDENPNLFLCGTAFECFGAIQKAVVHPTGHEQIKITLLEYCCIGHPTVMFKKKMLPQRTEIYSQDFFTCEDYHLWVELIKDHEFANLGEVLLHYRTHEHQISSENAIKQEELNQIAKAKAFLPKSLQQNSNAVNLVASMIQGNVPKNLDWDNFHGILNHILIQNEKDRFWDGRFVRAKLKTFCLMVLKQRAHKDYKFAFRTVFWKLFSVKEFVYWFRFHFFV